jgi:ribosomal protein S18 acetylase RimI-like enzyme
MITALLYYLHETLVTGAGSEETLALSFTLRPAALEDREFLFELFARTMRGVVEQTWGWNDTWQRAEFERRFRRYTVSVVESDARPVGGLFLEHGHDAIFIHEIQLLPEWQGRGIGTGIVQAVIEQATARGVPVELSVVPANPRAQRLYERLGFEVVAIESPFIRMRRGPSIPGDV